MNTLYKDSAGVRISVTCKDESGAVIDLTSKTATLKCYSFGNNTLAWSHAMTADVAASGTAHYDIVAGDFATAGDYYTLVAIAGTGYAYTMVDASYRIISAQDNQVTVKDFLRFIDIPQESAKPDDVVRDYLNTAEAQLQLDVPSLLTSVNPKYIQLKQDLIKLKAAIRYYMNMDEGNINPNIRDQKIKTWKEEYLATAEKLNEVLASDSENSVGAIRRIPNSQYSDSSSMYYIAP
ncbi:Uncharacterised protein [Candidatus Anstonella stagnisolia]|nr:Uncharacterised protein [Candidatus Anstonella stagnisolia]